jgi:hypothetical protein
VSKWAGAAPARGVRCRVRRDSGGRDVATRDPGYCGSPHVACMPGSAPTSARQRLQPCAPCTVQACDSKAMRCSCASSSFTRNRSNADPRVLQLCKLASSQICSRVVLLNPRAGPDVGVNRTRAVAERSSVRAAVRNVDLARTSVRQRKTARGRSATSGRRLTINDYAGATDG